MVCLDNSTHYLDIVILVDFIAYALVWLPQYTQVSRFVAALNFGVLGLAILAATQPAWLPDKTIPLLSLNISFITLFFLLINSIGDITFVFLTTILLGPVAYAGREHIVYWFDAQLNYNISDFQIAVGCVILFILSLYLYSCAHNSSWVQAFISTLVYCILVVIGIRVLWIEGSKLSNTTLCCGKDHEDSECPFVFHWPFYLLITLLFIVRFYLLYRVRRKSKKSLETATATVEEQEPLVFVRRSRYLHNESNRLRTSERSMGDNDHV
jgi:hypothetical protein